jgi:hypothetical protein
MPFRSGMPGLSALGSVGGRPNLMSSPGGDYAHYPFRYQPARHMRSAVACPLCARVGLDWYQGIAKIDPYWVSDCS